MNRTSEDSATADWQRGMIPHTLPRPLQYLVQWAVRSTHWRGPGPEKVEVLTSQNWFLHLLSCCCPLQASWCSSPRSRAWSSLRCNPSHTHTLRSAMVARERRLRTSVHNCFAALRCQHCFICRLGSKGWLGQCWCPELSLANAKDRAQLLGWKDNK